MKHSDIKIRRRPIEVQVYESVSEMVDHVYSQSKHRSAVRQWLSSKDKGFVGRSFEGPDDWKRQVEETWDEGIETIEKMVRDLEDSDIPRPISRKRRRVFDEFNGDSVDYDRLRSGQNFWQQGRRVGQPGPVTFTLLIDASTNWRQKHKDILWKGAAGVSVTKILEAAGYRVELWLVQYSRDNFTDTTDDLIAIQLKRNREPLNIATLSTAVAGWFYRSGIFAAKEMSCARRTADEYLGHPNYSLSLEHVQEVTPDPNYLIVKAVSQYDALVVAKKVIGKIQELQGVKLGK